MFDFKKAKESATEFYKTLNINGLAKALEDDEYWYFSGGTPNVETVGNLIISVKKNDGKIEIVKMPSHDNIVRLRSAKPIDLI